MSVAHDITRFESRRSQQLQKNTVLVVGCDEVDETDLLLCDLASETIIKAAEDGSRSTFHTSDPKYASLQLEAAGGAMETVYPR